MMHRLAAAASQIMVLFMVIVCGAPLTCCYAADFYVSPQGGNLVSGADGSLIKPWSLQFALSHPSSVRPGDTIWIRGGTYTGLYTSSLTGTSETPINVRPYQNEAVILDGASLGTTCVLTLNGAHTWYREIEVMSSSGNRTTSLSGSAPAGLNLPCGVNVFGPSTKVINFIVHDAAGGISPWSSATDAEIYGNLIYNNGWHGPDRGHGHAIYTQNNTGTKYIADNILFNQFSYGVHAYTEGGTINNFNFEGNVSFNNGALEGSYTTNFLLGGLKVADTSLHRGNVSYFPPGMGGTALNLGYSAGCTNALLDDNYLVGATAWRMVNCTGTVAQNNTFYGALSGVSASSYPQNTFATSMPISGSRVTLRKNKYNSDRAHLIIFNWDRSASVSVSFAEFLKPGDSFAITDAQNPLGAPISVGQYTGTPFSVPMTSTIVARPIGVVPVAPSHTTTQFGVFLVNRTLKAYPAPTAPSNVRILPSNPILSDGK